jgi:hypothetical protein
MIPPVVFDIDFTLTSEWYDNDEVIDLAPNMQMVNLAIALSLSGVPIIISTARPERLCYGTEVWLSLTGIEYEDLYMRADNDTRPDWQVKLDHLNSIETRHGKPLLWYDDNPDNIAAIKARGVATILVNSHA